MNTNEFELWEIVVAVVSIIFVLILMIRFIIYNKGKITYNGGNWKDFLDRE